MDVMRPARLGFGVAFSVVVGLTSFAHATPNDPALAEALFDEGNKLFEEADKSHDSAKMAQACAKFEASHKADPGHGAVFNLAACDEKLGKTASAWAAFLEAAALSKTPTDAAEAKARAEALVPKLVKLKLTVVTPTNDLVIKRDGAAQDRAAWSTAVPVDPGSHRIEADAPGKQPWSTTVVLEGEGKIVSIEVPQLVSNAPAASATSTSDAPRTVDLQRGAAIGVGVLGIAGLVTGGVLAGAAKSKWDAAKPHCDEQHFCDPAWVSTGQDARSLADGASVAWIVGGVGIAAAAALWLFAPTRSASGKPASPNATLWFGRETGGLTVIGQF